MEKASIWVLTPSFSLAEPVGFLFLYTVFSCAIAMLQKFTLRFLSFLQPHNEFIICSSTKHDEQCTKSSTTEDRRNHGLSREDVEMVLGRIGMCCSEEGECMGFDELANLFAEEEPSLEEVKEAFYVFDEGRDGFIDALELQRALSKLGFGEGFTLDACEGMIAAYDENRDGRIDLNEFVKLIERSFR